MGRLQSFAGRPGATTLFSMTSFHPTALVCLTAFDQKERTRHFGTTREKTTQFCDFLVRLSFTPWALVLDNDKFGPGNRPYWEMKEGRVSSRYLDLLRTLSKVQDPRQRRLLVESHRRKVREGGSTVSSPTRRPEPRRKSPSRQ